MDKLISVVIVNFNYGRFIESAIRSVVSQEGFDLCELIVVDGGSTDNSVEVIKKFQDKLSWWVSEPDKGQSDAFNKGFSHAKAKIGCWVNADDIMMPGTLKSVIKHLRQYPKTEWITGGMAFCNQDMKVVQLRIGSSIPPIVNPRLLPMTIIGGPSSFFPIEKMRKLGGFDLALRYTMDNDLWLRLIDSGCRFDHINRYFWAFRLHDESKTSPALIGVDGPVPRHEQERIRLQKLQSENVRKLKGVARLLSIWKIVNGSLLMSWLDELFYKGRAIERVK